MMDHMEHSDSFYYRSLLKQIDSGLGPGDIESIKFLCRDNLDEGSLEKINRGLELFVQLENKQLLHEKQTSYLGELLFRIGRCDLVISLGHNTDEIKYANTNLSLFRVLLHEIAKSLTTSEVDHMKFYATQYISRTQSDEINSAFALFVALEKRYVLTPNNLDILIQMLHVINRQDLITRISGVPGNTPIQAQEASHNARLPIAVADVTRQSPSPLSIRQTPSASHQDHGATKRASTEEYSTLNPYCDLALPNTPEEAGPGFVSYRMEKYDMSSKAKGYCVIINNETFDSPDLGIRKGTNMDRDNLKYVWSKLGFYIHISNNQTADQILQIISHYSKGNHENYSAFVCCILSHGRIGTVYGTDGKEVGIGSLMEPFMSTNCPSLEHKPKLFFLQACQSMPDPKKRHTLDTGQNNSMIPGEPDFLLGYSTVPGFAAHRDKNHGSWYINCLTLMLDKLFPDYDLMAILTKVNQEVSRQIAVDKNNTLLKQVPAPLSTLTKSFSFTLPSESK